MGEFFKWGYGMSSNIRENYRCRRRADFLRHVGDFKKLIGIEIGALDFPTFKKEESSIRYVDNFTYEELLEKYRDSPVFNLPEIVRPDYVIKDLLEYENLPERYDFVIACHVMEHLPNPFGFIQTLMKIVNSGGKLFLTIPDKRFIAEDRWRENTLFAHLFVDYLEDSKCLSFDHYFEYVFGREFLNRKDARILYEEAQKLYKRGTFEIHAHVWTDRSFRQQMVLAIERAGLALEVVFCGMTPYVAGLNEFVVILEKAKGRIA